MPAQYESCGIRVFILEWFSILFMFIQQRLHNSSAVCPSQRSGKSPFCHSPLFSMSRAFAKISGSSPTSRFVPIVTVSGCSAYVLNVIQGIPKSSFFRYVTRICNETLGMAH